MYTFRNIKFDPIGLWLFKWIIGPLVVLGITAVVIDIGTMQYKGRVLCKEYGYIESTYIPPNRVGDGEKYIFRKKYNPDGTIDEAAKLVIDLE